MLAEAHREVLDRHSASERLITTTTCHDYRLESDQAVVERQKYSLGAYARALTLIPWQLAHYVITLLPLQCASQGVCGSKAMQDDGFPACDDFCRCAARTTAMKCKQHRGCCLRLHQSLLFDVVSATLPFRELTKPELKSKCKGTLPGAPPTELYAVVTPPTEAYRT